MKTQITIAFAAAAMAFTASAATYTGVITDSMCDNGDHKDMKMGSDPKCVVECIKGMNGKYVLYDSKAKKAYVLSDQKTPEKFAAKKVTIAITPAIGMARSNGHTDRANTNANFFRTSRHRKGYSSHRYRGHYKTLDHFVLLSLSIIGKEFAGM